MPRGKFICIKQARSTWQPSRSLSSVMLTALSGLGDVSWFKSSGFSLDSSTNFDCFEGGFVIWGHRAVRWDGWECWAKSGWEQKKKKRSKWMLEAVEAVKEVGCLDLHSDRINLVSRLGPQWSGILEALTVLVVSELLVGFYVEWRWCLAASWWVFWMHILRNSISIRNLTVSLKRRCVSLLGQLDANDILKYTIVE